MLILASQFFLSPRRSRPELTIPFYRNAQPVEKLKDAYRKFIARSMRKSKAAEVCPFTHNTGHVIVLFLQAIYYSIFFNF